MNKLINYVSQHCSLVSDLTVIFWGDGLGCVIAESWLLLVRPVVFIREGALWGAVPRARRCALSWVISLEQSDARKHRT